MITRFDTGAVRTVVIVVLDSLRCDSFEAARKPVIDRFLPLQERRRSYATWTLPSHACLLAGLMPFQDGHGMQAAEVYSRDLELWAHLLTGSRSTKDGFVPRFSLADFARTAGWATQATMAMPILNRHSPFNHGFEIYDDSGGTTAVRLAAQLESVAFNMDPARRNFAFVNCGDTHYPYLLPPSQMPRVPGINGAAHMTANVTALPFTAEDYRAMWSSQVQAVEQADRALGHLLETLAKPALVYLVSDHGELFGEDGLFGHGPFAHPLLLEIPYAAGVVA